MIDCTGRLLAVVAYGRAGEGHEGMRKVGSA